MLEFCPEEETSGKANENHLGWSKLKFDEDLWRRVFSTLLVCLLLLLLLLFFLHSYLRNIWLLLYLCSGY